MRPTHPRTIEHLFRAFILVVCLSFPTVLALPLYGGKRLARSALYYPQRSASAVQWTPLPFAAYQPRVTRYYAPYSQDYSVEDYYPQAAYYYTPPEDSNYPYYYVDRPAGYYAYEDPYEEEPTDYEFAERRPKPKPWFEDSADNADADRFMQNIIDSRLDTQTADANAGTVIFAPAQSSKATGATRRDNDLPITYGTKKLSKYDDEDEDVRELKNLIYGEVKPPKKHAHEDEQSVYIAERDGVYDIPRARWPKKNALKPLPPLSRAHPDLFDETHRVSDRKLHAAVTATEATPVGSGAGAAVKKAADSGQQEVVYRPAEKATSRGSPSVIDTIKSLLSLEDSLNKVDDSGRPQKRSLVTSEESLVKELGALRKKENSSLRQ